MKTIWCLFSVENNYDQPSNNLICAWEDKPGLEVLSNALGMDFAQLNDKDIVAVVKVWVDEGGARIWNTDYRLQEIELGNCV